MSGAAASGAAINTSPNFADNANATGVPTNYTNWSNGSGTRVTGIAPQPYAFTLVGSAADECGIAQALLGRISTGWHVFEADITLVSGALTGSGMYMDWDGGGVALGFATDKEVSGSVIGAGTTGTRYKFRKLVQITAGTTYNNLYAMSHWSGHDRRRLTSSLPMLQSPATRLRRLASTAPRRRPTPTSPRLWARAP